MGSSCCRADGTCSDFLDTVFVSVSQVRVVIEPVTTPAPPIAAHLFRLVSCLSLHLSLFLSLSLSTLSTSRPLILSTSRHLSLAWLVRVWSVCGVCRVLSLLQVPANSSTPRCCARCAPARGRRVRRALLAAHGEALPTPGAQVGSAVPCGRVREVCAAVGVS